MIEFEEWIRKTVPKWSEQVIKLGATWDTFKAIDHTNTSTTTSTTSKKNTTATITKSNDDVLITDLVNGGIPLLVSRDIVSKAREFIHRMTNTPLTVYWDLDTISITTGSTSTTTKSTIDTIMTHVQTLLASYGHPINFRGYSRTLSSIVTEEQKYQLSSQYKFIFIDSSTEATTCGKEVSTKRIIIDALKSDSTVASSSSSVVASSNGSTNGNSNNSKSLLSTMCFITADNDIQFLLSTLDRPQIFKILITSSEPLLQQLTTYTKGCNLTFSWDDIVSSNSKKTKNSIAPAINTSRGVIAEKKPTTTSYAAAVVARVGGAGSNATTSKSNVTSSKDVTKKNIDIKNNNNSVPPNSKPNKVTTTKTTVPTPTTTTTTTTTATTSSSTTTPQDKQQQQQQLSSSDIQLLTDQIAAAALDLGDGQKHSALKSRVGSLVRLANPSRFPTREDLAIYLTQIVESNVCVETGYGEYKILTLVRSNDNNDGNNDPNKSTQTNTPPIEITKQTIPLSIEELPTDVITIGETTRPYVIFVPWSDCVNCAVFPPKAHVHTTEKWAMLMFETFINAQQAAVSFPWIRQSGDYLIDFRRRNITDNTNKTFSKNNKSNKEVTVDEVEEEVEGDEDENNEREEEGEEEVLVVRKPRNYNNSNNKNLYEQTDELQICAVVNVMEMLLKSDELYVSEPVLKYQLAARRGGDDGNNNKQFYYWIEKAINAGVLLLFRRPGVPKGRFYCLPYQLDNSRAACSPNDINTDDEEEHVLSILNNAAKDRWVTRKSIIESLQTNFERMKSPALRVRVFQNAARKELFFVAKDGSTQIVGLTKDDAYEYLKKAVAKRDAYNAAHFNNTNSTGNYTKNYSSGTSKPYRNRNYEYSSNNNNNYRNSYNNTNRTSEATADTETN